MCGKTEGQEKWLPLFEPGLFVHQKVGPILEESFLSPDVSFEPLHEVLG
jgi:hypothetical protein